MLFVALILWVAQKNWENILPILENYYLIQQSNHSVIDKWVKFQQKHVEPKRDFSLINIICIGWEVV